MNESTLVPREELSDLDWLARNVHKWPCGKHQPWCYVYQKGGKRKVSGNCITVVSPCVKIDKAQWLARRAELQNKPSWKKDAPDWAEWLAQDEDGEWKWLAGLPRKYVDGWTALKIKGCCKGIALGDWRDTLEKRPEQKAFKPLTSIEDNQEKDMKQDNGWYERGDLPPVGTECEIDLGAKWRKAFVVGRNYTGRIVVEIDTCDFIVADGCTFRPIRTEREVAIEEMCNVAGLDGLVFGLVAGELYDAGYRKQNLPAK